MAVTRAPVVAAMWMAKAPQPEPISATVMPGRSRNFAVARCSFLQLRLFQGIGRRVFEYRA